MGQGIDDLACHALQAELEHLEQTHRACTNDQGFGFNACRHGREELEKKWPKDSAILHGGW